MRDRRILKMPEKQAPINLEKVIVDRAHDAIDSAISENAQNTLIDYLISGVMGVPGAGEMVTELLGGGNRLDLSSKSYPKIPGDDPWGRYPLLTREFYRDLMAAPKEERDEILAQNPNLANVIKFRLKPRLKELEIYKKDVEGPESLYEKKVNELFNEVGGYTGGQTDTSVKAPYQSPMMQLLSSLYSSLPESPDFGGDVMGGALKPGFRRFRIPGTQGDTYQGHPEGTLLTDLLTNRIPGIKVTTEHENIKPK